jgi:hypothetical protein
MARSLSRSAFLRGASAVGALAFLEACGTADRADQAGGSGPGDGPLGSGSGSSGSGSDSGTGSGSNGSGSQANGSGGAGGANSSGVGGNNSATGSGAGGNSSGSGVGGSGAGGSGSVSGAGGSGAGGSGSGGMGGSPGPQCGKDASALPDHPWHPAFTIPLVDILAGKDKKYAVKSPNHSHWITVTAKDFAELNAKGKIVLISTTDSGHNHKVTITCMLV